MPNKLEDIKPDEISLVDVPATKRTFLFQKADVAEEARIIPNGIIICPSCDYQEALIDFVKSASEECPECGENLLSSDTKITFKKRRLQMKKKLSEILKAFLEDTDEELTDEELELIEKAEKALDPDASKALKGAVVLLSKYKDQYPDDVKSAINSLAKFAAFGAAKKADEDDEPDLKKAGAKLSKDTVLKLKKIFALMEKAPEALKLLKDMLPESAKKSDVENKIDTLIKEIGDLKKAASDDDEDDDDKKKKLKKKKDADDEDDEDEDEIMEKLNSLTKMVNKIAKTKGLKKSVDGNDADDEDDENEDVKKKGKKWSFSFAAPNKSNED